MPGRAIVGAVIGGLAMFFCAPVVLAALGFGAAGIIAKSLAAIWQSTALGSGGIGATIFSALQSVGAAGVGAKAIGTGAAIGAAVGEATENAAPNAARVPDEEEEEE